MNEQKLAGLLVCPSTKQPLLPADPEVLQRLNTQISAGTLRNSAGELLVERLTAGWIRADGTALFPIREGIPVLLEGESIQLTAA